MSSTRPLSPGRLHLGLQRAAGRPVVDLVSLATVVSRIPYGRPEELSAHGVVSAWRGTCTTKHLLFRDVLQVCEPLYVATLFHRVYRMQRREAARLWGPEVGLVVPCDGLTDVHTYARVTGPIGTLDVDVTFTIAAWDGVTSIPLACDRGDDYLAGKDPLGSKRALVERWCNPIVREPFIAALAALPNM